MMSDSISVATRKGLFSFKRRVGGWSIADVAFLAQPVSMCLADPRTGYHYAALTLGHFGAKLHRSRNGQWEEIAVPKYPEGATVQQRMPEDRGTPDAPQSLTKPASLSEIWALEPGGNNENGLLWAGTIPGGLFRSDDHGDTWQLVESLWNREERSKWFGGGKDDPGIHSVFVDPRDSQHVKVAVSCGGVWTTRDGGHSWECTSRGIRAEYMPPELAYDPVIQDPHRMVGCSSAPDHLWIQHHNGIFHSTDSSQNWEEIKDVKPSVFGFAVAVHPHDPKTAWFVPATKDETRVPVAARVVVTKTTDGGKSFTELSDGLPQEHAYDIVFRHALDVDETGERLAMGSTTGNFWISENGGRSWQCVSTNLPPVYAVRFDPAA
jgi:photosystem II stability/assembly factor-like uncharacterized protein